MKNVILNSLLSILAIVLLAFCSSEKKQDTAEEVRSKPLVAVVNFPLYTFANRIGGDMVEVFFPQIEGDPAYWEPDESSIEKFQNAALILLNGADYAKWVEKVSLPSSTQVNTSKSFSSDLIEIQGEVHSHGPEGEHSHSGFAFTTWLDMKNAEKQAETVYQALSDLLPDEKVSFEANFKEVRTRIQQFDDQLSELLGRDEDLVLFASHPVYQYLAKGYAVDIVSYHWEPDQMPSDAEWKEFEHELDHHSGRIMLWEDEPLPEFREKLEGIGVSVIVFNPGSNRSALDFIALMEQNIQNLESGMQ